MRHFDGPWSVCSPPDREARRIVQPPALRIEGIDRCVLSCEGHRHNLRHGNIHQPGLSRPPHGQDSVGSVQVAIVNDDDAQIASRKTKPDQAEIFDDRKVLAIPSRAGTNSAGVSQ